MRKTNTTLTSAIYIIVTASIILLFFPKEEWFSFQFLSFTGLTLIIAGIFCCFGFYLKTFNKEIFYSRKDLIFILLAILSICILSELCLRYGFINIYIIPFALIPIVTGIFLNSHIALITHLTTVIVCSLMALAPYDFLLIQGITGIVAVVSIKDLSQRSHLIKCSFMVLISYIVLYMSLLLYNFGNFSGINWMMMLYFGINFILLMFSYIVIYVLEKLFGYLSPITLVELSNINHPLLKRLSEVAPGTFQHSMQVSTLAAEAGKRIGANTQLIRTGTLYHDIGKSNNPEYFTENQAGGVNPHAKESFEESARIIIAHVHDGVKMAEKAHLPRAIINFITTHHGKSKTKYFYNTFRNEFPDKPIDEQAFTYPGPNPFTKETAIVMLADSVEAASRSLKEYTPESIKELINKIINDKINEGLLKESPLTFKDLEKVKESFLDSLLTINHSRISYPELKS